MSFVIRVAGRGFFSSFDGIHFKGNGLQAAVVGVVGAGSEALAVDQPLLQESVRPAGIRGSARSTAMPSFGDIHHIGHEFVDCR